MAFAALFRWLEQQMRMPIDHVTVCGNDLEMMSAEFATAGITTVYGGVHANGVTHMALAGFADGSYLELIAPMAGASVSQATGMLAGWMTMMLENAGAAAWAIRAEGIHDATSALRKRGIEVRGPERGGRLKPDGTRLEWEIALAGPLPAGSVLPFMIEDITKRELRVQTLEHELGIMGVARVLIGVRNLETAVSWFQRAYGWEAPAIVESDEYEARLTWFEGTTVVLAQGRAGSWIDQRVGRWGEGTVGFVLKSTERPEVARVRSGFAEKVWWLDLAGARIGVGEK